MKKDELIERTKNFAHGCVRLVAELQMTKLEQHIAGQLIRSSTSTAANYRATCLAQSKPSFIAKISITLEEADESAFWLEFILDENLINKDSVLPLLNEARELTAIFFSSRKTAGEK